MLFLQTLPTGTLDLLKDLSAHVALKDFALAGGTSLALRFGHRISEDLDFFSSTAFENEFLASQLKQDFEFEERHRSSSGITAFISDVKVDLVKYGYPLLQPIEQLDGIRLLTYLTSLP